MSGTMLPEMLVGIGLAANLLVVAFARHFPYQDAPNHLARYVVIERVLWGQGDRDYSFRWVPSPYIAVDLVGACLVRLFGPTEAGKILAGVALALPTLGMYLLLRTTAPGRRRPRSSAILSSTAALRSHLATLLVGWSVPIELAADCSRLRLYRRGERG